MSMCGHVDPAVEERARLAEALAEDEKALAPPLTDEQMAAIARSEAARAAAKARRAAGRSKIPPRESPGPGAAGRASPTFSRAQHESICAAYGITTEELAEAMAEIGWPGPLEPGFDGHAGVMQVLFHRRLAR